MTVFTRVVVLLYIYVVYSLVEMVTLPNSPRKSAAGNSVIDIETDTDYLKIAKKGGGHKGKWCSNQGLCQKIKNWTFALIYSPKTCHPQDTHLLSWLKSSFSVWGGGVEIFAAGHLISKNLSVVKLFLVYHSASFCSFLCVSLLGAFVFLSDLLSIEHHTPTPEKVTYDKTDGQWYTHDGVDVKETQQRLGEKGQWHVVCYRSPGYLTVNSGQENFIFHFCKILRN